MRDGFVNKYLDRAFPLRVLDVGSYDVNGTYRDLFKPPYIYTGTDIEAGPNVDIVGWENVPDRSFDLVISGQVMEHVERPWEWIKQVRETVIHGGLICIIVPHVQKEHKYPLDCYRFFPDGMKALFNYADIEIMECYKNPIQNTRDTIGIGQVWHY